MSDQCCGGACQETQQVDAPGPWWRELTTRLVAAGAMIGAGAAFDWFGWHRADLLAYAVAIALSASQPLRGAWRSITRRTLDINVLMVIAVAGAAALGDGFEAATVVWLFGIANRMESYSLERARRAVRRVMTLAPPRAVVRRGDRDEDVPADSVAPGDLVVARPGARLPVDGVVRAGASAIDQSPVTGESFPVDVMPGSQVYAGTINGDGALEIEALRPASDSTLARIVHLLEHAERLRAPAQAWIDRFARRYTPAVVLLAAAVAVLPLLTGGWGADAATWFYRALTLLVVACPCALVISTPVSVISALTAAARQGVLIKGGVHLERLGGIKCVAFDKTGTLTAGRIRVRDIRAVAGATRAEVLAVAASLEARSEHPIGRAIVEHARASQIGLTPSGAFRALPGLGAEGAVGNVSAVVGSHRLFEERQLCTPALHAEVTAVESAGRTPVLVGHAGAGVGVLALSDDVREGSRRAIALLRREGIEHVVLLTGDHHATAEIVRSDARLDEAHASLLPGDKVEHVQRLRHDYGPVAMIGDGINDAPALAAADVGIAMGVAGSDVAIDTADVALLTDDLEKLSFAVRLGRSTLQTIHANVAIALGLKLVFVAMAVSGIATLWMAVLADTGASLIVTANSLRLLRVR